MQMLFKNTDETHVLTTKELIAGLEQQGIHAERKSIYDDIATLQDYGVDIIQSTEKSGGYYIASREFELAELKLLVDSVQSSKFITTKKSRELIAKLETLLSKNEAKQLSRQVVVTNRNKTVNENIYYNVDMIYNGIATNVKIRFQYFEWTISKEMKIRKGGDFYEVSPWILTWDDENYYMIAYDSKAGLIKHFRVDKMLKIEMTKYQREGLEQFEHFDIAAYTKKTFGMFAGEEQSVSLICENRLIGVMIDRFGQEVSVRKQDEEHFRVRVKVAISSQFFGWLCGLGAQVKIDLPKQIAESYQNYLNDIQRQYEKEDINLTNEQPLEKDYKYCEVCGRTRPLTYTKDCCPACEELQLFDKVRDYVRSHDANEYDVAEYFGISLRVVKQWIRDGRMEYKEATKASMVSMYCSRCGAPVNFGTLCPKCLKLLNGEVKGYAINSLSNEIGKMRFLDSEEEI